MGLEIERRFIVKGDNWKYLTKEYQAIKQGYLINELKGWTIRIRIINEKESWITLKYPHSELSRHEFEYQIPLKEAIEIMKISKYKVNKIRYVLNLNPGDWIVDCFQGKNEPLVIAEVELNSPKEIIEQPKWCQKEVTGIEELSNASLAKEPISHWPIDKKRSIL